MPKKTATAKEWIGDQKWSLRQGAAQLGCSASALRLYLNGDRRWPADVAARIETLSKGRVPLRDTVLVSVPS